MPHTRSRAERIRPGDWGTFDFAGREVWAQVLEDRGRIGSGGRRLLRVRLDQTETDPMAFSVAADELEPAAVDPAEVVRYVKGGLVAVLRQNLVGGPTPRAWLTFDPRGRLAFTLDPARGAVGGVPVPYFALIEERVYAAKRPQVVAFLTAFGLSEADAQGVIDAVGTAP